MRFTISSRIAEPGYRLRQGTRDSVATRRFLAFLNFLLLSDGLAQVGCILLIGPTALVRFTQSAR
jgi:hypothetical protein